MKRQWMKVEDYVASIFFTTVIDAAAVFVHWESKEINQCVHQTNILLRCQHYLFWCVPFIRDGVFVFFTSTGFFSFSVVLDETNKTLFRWAQKSSYTFSCNNSSRHLFCARRIECINHSTKRQIIVFALLSHLQSCCWCCTFAAHRPRDFQLPVNEWSHVSASHHPKCESYSWKMRLHDASSLFLSLSQHLWR